MKPLATVTARCVRLQLFGGLEKAGPKFIIWNLLGETQVCPVYREDR